LSILGLTLVYMLLNEIIGNQWIYNFLDYQ